MKRYLFFLRAYNDTDNIAPAIYFLLRGDPRLRASIFYYSLDYDFRDDANLCFLRREFGERVDIDWIGYHLGVCPDLLFREDSLGRAYEFFERFFPTRRLYHAIIDSPKFSQRRRREIIASALTIDRFPKLVVFDLNRSKNVGGLMKELRAQGVKRIVALPVSPLSNVNVLRRSKLVTLKPSTLDPEHDYSAFDQVALTDKFYLENVNALYELQGRPSPFRGKAEALGSLRFCSEWMALRARLYKPFHRPSKKRKLVFFLSDPATNTNWKEVIRSIEILSEYRNYDVIVKPHTRHYQVSLGSVPLTIAVETGATSSALIDWADVVMFWGSSIALEAYIKGKVPLCLDYLSANRSVFAKLDAGWIIHTRDDLHKALIRLQRDLDDRSYCQENIDRLIFETVQNGNVGSVPDRYIDFLSRYECGPNYVSDGETSHANL